MEGGRNTEGDEGRDESMAVGCLAWSGFWCGNINLVARAISMNKQQSVCQERFKSRGTVSVTPPVLLSRFSFG